MELIRQKLKSFAAGDYIRIFQTEDALYKTFSKSKEHDVENSELKDYPVKFHYLMKDEKTMEVNKFFSKDFLDWLDVQISDDKSEVYYNTDMLDPVVNLVNPSVLQYNERCYFLTKNSYANLDYSSETSQYSPYMIYQTDGYTASGSALPIVSSYISQTYDQSYFSNSHFVEDKTIPIYDFSSKLDSIDIIKLRSKADIDEFIKKYSLESISGEILFDSSSFEFSTSNYDSISVSKFLEILASQNKILDSSRLSKMFEDLLAGLDYTSFLRMFDKRGEISQAFSGEEMKKSNSLSRFMSSFSLGSSAKFLDAPMNYFTLKVLKNPENEHDYSFESLPNAISVASPNFNFNYTVLFEAMKIWKSCIEDRLKNWFNEKNAVFKYKTFFDNEETKEKIFNILSSTYSMFNADALRKDFDAIVAKGSDILSNSFIEEAYLEFISSNFGVNLRAETNIGTKNDLYTYLKDAFGIFEEEFRSFSEDKMKSKTSNALYSSLSAMQEILDRRYASIAEILLADEEEDIVKTSPEFEFVVDEGKLEYKAYPKFIGITSSVIEKSHPLVQEEIDTILNLASCDNVMKELSVSGFFDFGIFKTSIAPVIEKTENSLDYLNAYSDLWKHENQFTVSGLSYGSRDYFSCVKSASNDLNIFYNYGTKFDKRLLEDLGKSLQYDNFDEISGVVTSLISENVFSVMSKPEIRRFFFTAWQGVDNPLQAADNKLNARFRDIGDRNGAFSLTPTMTLDALLESPSDFGYFIIILDYNVYNIKVVKLSEDEYCIVKKGSWQDKYFSTFELMKNVDFVERIEGEHYYTEIDKHKSNVFSLEVKNSGLSDIEYSLDEVCRIIELDYKDKLIDSDDLYQDDYYVFKDKENNIIKKNVFTLLRVYENSGAIVERDSIYNVVFRKALENSDFVLKNAKLEEIDNLDYEELKLKDLRFSKKNANNVLSKTKEKLRKTFEEAVRKSISRYIPVDTTLWKIVFID